MPRGARIVVCAIDCSRSLGVVPRHGHLGLRPPGLHGARAIVSGSARAPRGRGLIAPRSHQVHIVCGDHTIQWEAPPDEAAEGVRWPTHIFTLLL
eukprot:scaffold140495_cov31-Tisochrysis_lutea.AAC.1